MDRVCRGTRVGSTIPLIRRERLKCENGVEIKEQTTRERERGIAHGPTAACHVSDDSTMNPNESHL